MDATEEEAFRLLSAWQAERRIVLVTLEIPASVSCCVIGRIEEFDGNRMRIDDRSISVQEARTGIEIDLLNADGYKFDDTRIAAGFEDADRIRETYDGFLFVSFPNGATVNLWVANDTRETD